MNNFQQRMKITIPNDFFRGFHTSKIFLEDKNLSSSSSAKICGLRWGYENQKTPENKPFDRRTQRKNSETHLYLSFTEKSNSDTEKFSYE